MNSGGLSLGNTILPAGSRAASESRLESGARSPSRAAAGHEGLNASALSPLSSSPARRSALRGTPARPGLPSQSDGTPPPLAAAAASASFLSSSRGGRRERRHLGSDGGGGGGNRARRLQLQADLTRGAGGRAWLRDVGS